MNKPTQFAWEYRLRSITEAISLADLNMVTDFCRGFIFALLSADVISEADYDDMGAQLNSAFGESLQRLSQADKPVVIDHLEVSKHEEPEQVSVPAASSRLSVRRLFYRSFSTQVQRLHPKIWCPLDIWAGLHALKRLPAGWSPLPGKRPLVGGEGEVRLSSVQASA